MSTPFEFTPDPGIESNASEPFDFSALNAEETEPLAPHTPPVTNPDKKVPWWKNKPKDRTAKVRVPKIAPSMPRGGLKTSLESMYAGVGMAVMAFDPHCGQIIIENAEACAKAMDELAKTNPAVRRILMRMVATSAMGTVIAVHAPIFMAIAMHHVPALREKQEKMAADMAEAFANMGHDKKEDE